MKIHVLRDVRIRYTDANARVCSPDINQVDGARRWVPPPPLSLTRPSPLLCAVQFYMTPAVICLMGGLLPFGSIFIEMYFIFTSFWNYKVRQLQGLDSST